MIRNGMARKIAFQKEKAKQVEDIQQLNERWLVYPPAVQAMLQRHLAVYGVRSTQDITDIMARYTQSLRDRPTGRET